MTPALVLYLFAAPFIGIGAGALAAFGHLRPALVLVFLAFLFFLGAAAQPTGRQSEHAERRIELAGDAP